jgi:hypothetical protein
MQFRVPQFIDIEDKIFGPFSFKQFVYMAGGAGIAFVAYKILPLFFAALIIIPVLALSGALTFYKVNNKPFIFILESSIRYFFQSKLYIWKKEKKKIVKKETEKAPEVASLIPRLSQSKLKDISWSLDVLDVNKK